MSLDKKLGIVIIACLITVLGTICFADAIAIPKKQISFINFDPIYVIEGHSQVKDIKAPEGVNIVGYTWLDREESRFMVKDEKYKSTHFYAIRMFFEPADGYEFKDNFKVAVNGGLTETKLAKEPSQYMFEREYYSMTEEFAAETKAADDAYRKEQEERKKAKEEEEKKKQEESEHPLKKIEVEVDVPEAGKQLPEKCKIKTNITGKYKEYEIGERADDGFYPYWDTNFFPGLAYGNITYTFKVKLYDDTISPKQSKNITGLINGEDCYGGLYSDGTINLFVKYRTGEMPREEKKRIYDFAFTIDEPKVGEKPSTNAKEVNEGYKTTKVVWTPDDNVFEGGKEYKVEIFFEKEEEYVIAGTYTTTINNKVAIQQAERPGGIVMIDRLCAEYTFPKLEGAETTEKTTWSKASNWAEPELEKANEEKIIPDIFEEEDLTKTITRREFAHIAVKLWEKLSGSSADVGAKNPFTDTDDIEVLKAYNLQITNGTSDTTFSPDQLITREQMATMMTRALSKAGIDTSVDLDKVSVFADDAELHSWGKEAVYYMANLEIIKGVGNNAFGANGDATREQSLIISLRSVEKMK